MTPAKCPDDGGESSAAEEKQDLGEDISDEKDGGLYKLILKEGSGEERPFSGSEVRVHYVGRLINGKKFDSSRDRLQPFQFLLGSGSVIKGWDLGVKTMKKGEICILTCSPEYGYGAAGSLPAIPPKATLKFEIELLEWSEMAVCGDNEVTKVIVQEGMEWQNPSKRDIIEAHIIGTCQGAIFLKDDFNFELCEATEYGLCKGLERGIGKMTRNEKSRFKVRAGEFGYTAEQRAKLNIPDNTDVQFLVHLKDFERVTPVWDMDSAGRVSFAKTTKERGNSFFKQGKFELALQKYEIQVQALDGIFKDEDKEEGTPLKLAGHLNCAACHLKMSAFLKCIDECTKALDIDPDNVKALFRRGSARLKIGDTDLARQDLLHAVKIDPNNKNLRELLKEANDRVKSQKKKEKNIYANMFQKFAEEDKKLEARKDEETSQKTDEVLREAVDQAPTMEEEEDDSNAGQSTEDTMEVNT